MNLPSFATMDDFRAFEKKTSPENGLKGILLPCEKLAMFKDPGHATLHCGGWHQLTGSQEERWRIAHLPKEVQPLIKLTAEEVARAEREGRYRRDVSIAQKLPDPNNAKLQTAEQFYEQDMNGRAAEIAWAKWSGLPEAPLVGAYHQADSGHNIGVRSSPIDWYNLIIRKGDPIEHYFVLLTGLRPQHRIRGWLTAAEGQRVGIWTTPKLENPYWKVAQRKLKPIAQLIELLEINLP